jgi:hypothetical protein
MDERNQSLRAPRMRTEQPVPLRGRLGEAAAAISRSGSRGINDLELAKALRCSPEIAGEIMADLSYRSLIRKVANDPNAWEHPRWVVVDR